jgi:hypothetical protein
MLDAKAVSATTKQPMVEHRRHGHANLGTVSEIIMM